jgi:hypothetical protein
VYVVVDDGFVVEVELFVEEEEVDPDLVALASERSRAC